MRKTRNYQREPNILKAVNKIHRFLKKTYKGVRLERRHGLYSSSQEEALFDTLDAAGKNFADISLHDFRYNKLYANRGLDCIILGDAVVVFVARRKYGARG